MTAGRKRIQIDREQVINLAKHQWSNKEIAAHFRVSWDTINRHFAEDTEKARLCGAAKLRDMQWAIAEKGNVPMIIHMSKFYLNQRDRIEIEDLKITDKREMVEKLREAIKRLEGELQEEKK